MHLKTPPHKNGIQDLLDIIRSLRGPEGCLWDRKQTSADIARYLIEEAYEVVDAVSANDQEEIREELGDLLFQILFLAVLAEEQEIFGLKDVVASVAEKMIRRHPHVFGDACVENVEEIKRNWAYIKEHVEKKPVRDDGYLGRYPRSMPALVSAQKMTEKAATVGFDWDDIHGVLDKIEEEFAELKNAMASGKQGRIEEEIGDLLFSLVNLCRFARVEAEASLKKAAEKFSRRFNDIEKTLANQNKTLLETSAEEMNRLWEEIKSREGMR